MAQKANQEILEKAIQKAIDGGWRADAVGMVTIIPVGWMQHDHYKGIIFNHDFAKALWGDSIAKSKCHAAPLFQEPRLKDKPLTKPYVQYKDKQKQAITQRLYCTECKEANGFTSTIGWKTNLQQMVIADDPIKYLWEHLG
jgi:hypothetical protein